MKVCNDLPDETHCVVVLSAEVEMLLQQRHMGSIQINSIKMWSIDDRVGDDWVRGSGPIRWQETDQCLLRAFL